ncbi:hypothetical protein C9374_005462 [Naegleria lovaniensis]|uniref:Metaxin n=1 Tax=Naegleria lovaniensis TaxID=51637 RepID=A0AA88GQK0_NAELO|nr:uncharacterized protein C9374_005462 [Naegleria lovaniensis]KAG2382260.1 hypothetical protein C9374_005462 [Naegleria lovaniensis]
MSSSSLKERLLRAKDNNNLTSTPHNYTLYLYKQGLQLPTMDIHCMMILSYIQLLPNQYQQYINIKFENKYMNIILHDQDTNKYYYGIDDIMKVIQNEFLSVNDHLSTRIQFLNTLINEQLLPILIHYWYGHDDNYTIVYDSYVGNLSLIDGIRLHFIKNKYLKHEYYRKLKSQKTEEEIYELLQHSLQLISNLLVENNGFILDEPSNTRASSPQQSSKPSELDAKLYAILSCLYYPEFVSKHYRDLFRHYPPLMSYLHRMSNKYFNLYMNEEILKEPTLLGTQSPQVICELLRRLRVKREHQHTHTWYFLGGCVAFMSAYYYVMKRIAVVNK